MSIFSAARSAHITFRLTCEAELARILHEDFSRIRDKPPSQVEAFVRCYFIPNTNLIPYSICSKFSRFNLYIRSINLTLSITLTCDTTATESFDNFVSSLSRITLPGASANNIFVVNGITITVFILLSLNALSCSMSTGRRNPGSLPKGIPKSAHHISPRIIFC